MTLTPSRDFKKLVRTMLPLLFSQLAVMGMNFMDITMSGHASADDLAGVSIGASLFMPIITSFMGILAAGTPMMAQLLGRKEKEKIPAVVRTGLCLGIIFTGIMALLYALFITPVLQFLNLEPAVAHVARYYLLLMVGNILFQSIIFPLRSMVDTVGSTLMSMKLFFLALPVNGLLNYMFIFGKLGAPRLGGIGAGIATTITSFFLLLMFLLLIGKTPIFMARELTGSFETGRENWKEYLSIGIPNGLSTFMETSLFGFIVIFIAPFGTEAIAGHQAALNFSTMIYVIPMSCSLALTILVGYEVGAGRYDRARKFSHMGIRLTLTCAAVTVCLTLLCRYVIAGIYSNDAPVQAYIVQFLFYGAGWQVFDATAAPIQGILRGYKDTRIPFVLMLIAYWCGCLPMGLFLDHVMGHGVYSYWQGLVFGVGCSATLMVLRLRYMERKYRLL
jgi:MATE family multidrug resistance protein